MHAFIVDFYAHAKLKSLVGMALPHVKSSHRAEAIARGFGYSSNAALLASIKGASILSMSPVRFARYLSSKGWNVPGSIFVASCFRLRPYGLDTLHVPRWGTALVDGEWTGLVLWDRRLAHASLDCPKDADGPTWFAEADLTGIPLTIFRDRGEPLPRDFEYDARARLRDPANSTRRPGGYIDLAPYLGGEPFPHGTEDMPEFEIFGASSLPVTLTADEVSESEARKRAAGWYAGLVTF